MINVCVDVFMCVFYFLASEFSEGAGLRILYQNGTGGLVYKSGWLDEAGMVLLFFCSCSQL